MSKSPAHFSFVLMLAASAAVLPAGCSFFEPERGPWQCTVDEVCGPNASTESTREACSQALADPSSARADLLDVCRQRAARCETGTAPAEWCTDSPATNDAGISGAAGKGGEAGSSSCGMACKPDAGSGAAGSSGAGGGDAGSTAGTGGTSGSSACGSCPEDQVCDDADQHECVGCLSDSDCGDETPACDLDQHQCVGCTDSSKHCGGSTAVCDSMTKACVQCLHNTDCGDETPVCDLERHQCVACLADKNCKAATPACDLGQNICVGCTSSSLHCKGSKPLCDSNAQACVQCLSDTDCADPAASRCNAGHCEPCTESTQCGHIAGHSVCDPSSGAGQCVQCTGKQYEACGLDTANTGRPFVCDSSSRTCSGQTAGSSGLCGQCVSDAECPAGQLCMLQEFDNTTIGYFCVWQRAAGVGGAPNSCTNARPYFKAIADAESIDGTTADICTLRVSTCPAHIDFGSPAINCAPAGTPNDTLCGFGGAADGYCRALPAPEDDVYRCTVPCLTSDDCRVGTDCDIVSNPPYCKL